MRQKYTAEDHERRVNIRNGTMRELLVAADLTRRGYEVFLPTCPATCDMVVLDITGRALRVEVKSGSRMYDGRLAPVANVKAWLHDVLAVVLRDNTIVYTPALPDDIAKRIDAVA